MKIYAIIAAVCLALGFGIGTQLFPTVKEKTVEVEKIVKDVQTVTRIVTRPDGTKEEVTTIVDRSKESKSTTHIIAKSQWHAGVGVSSNIDRELVYGVHVEKRIVGDLFLGVSATTDKRIGASVSIEF